MSVVDEWIMVSEDEICAAVRGILEHHKKVVEGAAGVAVAAMLKDKGRDPGIPAVVLLCGANIGLDALRTVVAEL
jgi:threonine dehydratase